MLKKLLLADSICKYVGDLPGVEQKIIRGAYFETFAEKINDGEIVLSGIDAILIHIGTNNMALNFEPQSVLAQLGSLIRAIHRQSVTAHVIVSGILPRLFDLKVSERPVKEYNKMLARVCRDHRLMMIRSYNAFISGKEPRGVKEWLYARDGLHLSDRGSYVLTQMFRVQFSDMNILKRREVIDAENEKKVLRDSTFNIWYGLKL